MPSNKPIPSTAVLLALLIVSVLSGCAKTPSASNDATGARSALFSDADQIAYLRLTDNYWQAWVTDSQGQQHRQLTFDAVDKTRLSWSPDRQWLLCNRNDGQLVVVPLKQNDAPRLLHLPVQGMLDAQWSPDGQWIIFSLQSTQQQDNNDLWIIKNDGQGARKLVNQPGVSQLPAWHPDGTTLVYAQYKGREAHHLWRFNTQTRSREQLTLGDASFFDPVYSGSGQLAYTSNQSGNYDIWLRNGQGKNRQLTEHAAYDAQPAWSPKGNAIAFYSQRDNQRRIWIKSLDKGKPMPITPANVFSRNPVWR